jgi:hypothetical protein
MCDRLKELRILPEKRAGLREIFTAKLRQRKEGCRKASAFFILPAEQMGQRLGNVVDSGPPADRELPRDVLQAMGHLTRRSGTLGLGETQLCERLNHLQELQILPEYRVQPDLASDNETESTL